MKHTTSLEAQALALALLVGGCAMGDEDETITLANGVSVMDAAACEDDAAPDGGREADAGPDTDGGVAEPVRPPENWLDLPDVMRDTSSVIAVYANGTGCPRGTGAASLSLDNRTLTVVFSSFEAAVNKQQTLAVKDCQLGIKLRNAAEYSYAVTEAYTQGYAYLEKGQSARMLFRYYFQGSPVQAEEVRADLVGPYDDTFTVQDTVRTTDLVWSPCGVARDLNVRTTLRLTNDPKKDGYINLNTLDASTDAKLRLKLSWRRCDTSK